VKHAILTGCALGNTGTVSLGEVGYMPPDPANYDEAVSVPHAERWKDKYASRDISVHHQP